VARAILKLASGDLDQMLPLVPPPGGVPMSAPMWEAAWWCAIPWGWSR
jgi:hypothetical protein